MQLEETTIQKILNRTSGFLSTVCSHSVQPYRGCTLGQSLCGVGCYVQHSRHMTQGRPWGSFLEVRVNAADSYRKHFAAERRWARAHRGQFSLFLSSATEPFLPQETRYGITRSLLEAMRTAPPDELILQTHSHRVANYIDLLVQVAAVCSTRVHVSIESDRESLPGLPPPASSVEHRFRAAQDLRAAGLQTVITVAPLLPIANPDAFFLRISQVAHAVVIDHFIAGDGTADGHRTLRTPLPAAMQALDPASISLEYRQKILEIALRYLPGRVGVNIDGFAGRFLPDQAPSPPAGADGT